ncbi:MAG: NADH-quinone oxidoreductase subunit M, partial [Alphaproteobacteria bacterium]|nr:NADH-quinone oxidoreductase subunit M [Alphaproteobacteria bacterium]
MDSWLSFTIFLPLAGVFFILISGSDDSALVARRARDVALLASGATFLASLALWYKFDPASAEMQLVESHEWFGEGGFSYHVGIDGISLFFVLLSTFLTPLCILASGAIQTRVKEYMISFLVLETLMVGMFAALDIMLFYVFFEGVLIPMFLIIGVWGGPRRVYA